MDRPDGETITSARHRPLIIGETLFWTISRRAVKAAHAARVAGSG
jgi:hypothetical protein